MRKNSLDFSYFNICQNDNDTGKDVNNNINDCSFLQIFPSIKNSNNTIISDNKLNNDIEKIIEISIIQERKPIFGTIQEKKNSPDRQIEFTIINTKDTNKILELKTKRNEDNNNNLELNLDNKINIHLDFKKNENIFIEINEKTQNKIEEKKKKMMGRKRKDEKEIRNHNKNSKDNMMRKIKTFLFNACNNLLNNSLKDKDLKFLNLDNEIITNLKKDDNIKLLNTTIRNLYENSSISKKYDSYNSDNNKIIIEKIYKEKEEIETIEILNLTFLELLKIFRRNISNISIELKEKIENINILNTDEYKNIIKKFFEDIKIQESKKNENEKNITDYINNIKKLIINYEFWFFEKKGRDRKKNR